MYRTTKPKLTFYRSPYSRPKTPKPPETGYQVQNKHASLYEWRVAKALDRLKLEYIFQQPIMGGRTLRGGFIIDFLVLTAPLPTPMWVHGEYWHVGKQQSVDDLQQAILRSAFAMTYGEPVILWGEKLQTDEDAYRAVREALRQ